MPRGALGGATRCSRRCSISPIQTCTWAVWSGRAQVAKVGSPAELGPALCAQCHGLQAELLARQGDLEAALHEYASCRQAWEDLGRREDAAEAALEAVLVAASYSGAPESGKAQFVPSLKLLTNLLEHGRRLLGVDEVNALLVLAEARIQYFSGDEEKAERTAQRARAWLTRPIGVSGHGGPRRSKRRYWKPQGNALRPLE